ncbi:hypothetical protein HNR22_001065 [Micromonospora jinlongensis]|uniref:Uncharacterized protein n=1 Tax=Micromonospora jinlongensis TaxID=1287877 RepID=A0A7Z0BBL9_9ACTN|nr:hypothetical protein [Micromonospora jinlongensis]NYH41338.1 hypothetical protein [Micromonospora jinlongensis]
MTDAPDGRPRPADQWRHRGVRGLTIARDASVRGWRWWARHWDRLVAALQDEAPVGSGAAPSPPGPLVEQRDVPRLITVPARGYVYSFHIRATFAWSSSTSLRSEVLSWYVQYFQPNAIQRLTRLAADAARNLPPHRAGDLEVALRQALADEPEWSYQRGDIVITCRPDAAVRLDERIMPALQPHVDRLLELEYQFDEQVRKARYAEELSRQWATLLNTHADDQDVADARDQMLTTQREAARWITELLRRHAEHPADAVSTPLIPPQQSRPNPAQPASD